MAATPLIFSALRHSSSVVGNSSHVRSIVRRTHFVHAYPISVLCPRELDLFRDRMAGGLVGLGSAGPL